MRNLKIHQDHLRAALRMEEHKLKILLDDIELNDASPEKVNHQILHIEDGLKRLRRLLPSKKAYSWTLKANLPGGLRIFGEAA